MNDLITIENNVPVLNIETIGKIKEIEKVRKAIEDAEKTIREQIKAEMESKMIKTIKTPDFTITYRAEYDRENFDKKAFKKDHPDLHDQYITMSHCQSSITIKMEEKLNE